MSAQRHALEPALPPRAAVLVVGAGLAGASTAHHLAARGVRCLVLERRRAPGLEASGRSACIVRTDCADPVTSSLVAEGACSLRSGVLAPFRRTGLLLVGRGDTPADERFPRVRGSGLLAEEDGVVDARHLLRTYLGNADVRCGVEVLGLAPRGEVIRVETSLGHVEAEVVVNAAGAWAGELGSLRLEPRKRHLFLACVEGVSGNEPIAWDEEQGLYFRPEAGGLLVCPCDETPSAPGANDVAVGAWEDACRKMSRLQPGLALGPLRCAWAGQRTFALDGRFVVGWDPRCRGLFWVAALGGHGVTTSPSVGRLAADLLVAGPGTPASPIARALSPARLL